ncbi:hypothetical protein HY478_01280 [Candidatus Uhrbacteria bacterium]|nr:hypothetical protein [Candidatus Uhrbacteria bacterium]
MASNVRQCQNCTQEFTVKGDDRTFYEKIDVPVPSLCPDCRYLRRLVDRNEWSLYRRKCDATGKTIVSIYREGVPFPVYHQDFWKGDGWDPMDYGMPFSEDRPLLQQLKELMDRVPRAAVFNLNCVNCHYCAKASFSKNCYYNMSFNAENCMYGHYGRNVRDSVDYLFLAECELCYECVYCYGCANLTFSSYSSHCSDSSFLYDCRNCHNCFGCVGLRNKSYHIFNEPYTKDEYNGKMEELNVHGYSSLNKAREKAQELWLSFPRRFANLTKCENVIGDRVYGSKNCYHCFDVNPLKLSTENCKYLLTATNVADSYDVGETGEGTQLCYEVFEGWGSGITFSNQVLMSQDVSYSYNCYTSSNLFACVGLRNKKYCILNTQYSKEEYERMVKKIREHMDRIPYTDRAGRIYRYGEFFPPELSVFSYNESVAYEYFPITREVAEARNFRWREREERRYEVTKQAEELPENIEEVDETIREEMLGCEHRGTCDEQCTKAFKMIPAELQFYKRMNVPLPRRCPNCRHRARTNQRNPLKLWHRACMCAGRQSAERYGRIA